MDARVPGDPKFAFIKDEHGDDRFFHAGAMAPDSSTALRELKVGDAVTFEPATHHKGERATNVRLT